MIFNLKLNEIKNSESDLYETSQSCKNFELKKILSALQVLNLEISRDIESFHLNSSVARIRSFSNLLFDSKFDSFLPENFAKQEILILKFVLESFLIILEPFIPHFSQIIFELLNGERKEIIYKKEWPKVFQDLIIKENPLISINVNGKKRSELEIGDDWNEEKIKEVSLSKLIESGKILENQEIKKSIYIKNKMINLII
jgi:leucyl-tRNA synthetase